MHISLLDPLAAQNITACPCRMGAVSDFVNLIADTHIELVSVLAGTEPDAYRRFDQIAAEKALVQREVITGIQRDIGNGFGIFQNIRPDMKNSGSETSVLPLCR